MKKRTKAIIILTCALGATLPLAACAIEEAPFEDFAAQAGGIVNVVYERNGGVFARLDGVDLIDSYPLSLVQKEGGVRLVAPGSSERNSGTNTLNQSTTTVSRENYSAIGWYTDCEQNVRVDEDNNAIDEDGNLVSVSGKEQGNVYEGLWDFATKRLTLDMCTLTNEGEKYPIYEFHLYVAWQPELQYNFFRQTSEEEKREAAAKGETIGDWIEYGSVSSSSTVSVPQWDAAGGGLNLNNFEDASSSFGVTSGGYTLSGVYGDPARQKVYAEDVGDDWLHLYRDTAVIDHPGYVDKDNGLVYNSSVNIYTTWKEGRWMRIKEATQMIAYDDGCYILENDLDFSKTNWNFSGRTFRGKIYGNNYKISNITSTQTQQTTQLAYGGVFGQVSAAATIENVRFENVTFNLTGGTRLTGGSYGLFAGILSSAADISGVSVSGTYRIGGSSFNTRGREGQEINDPDNGIFIYDLGLIGGNGVTHGIAFDEIEVTRASSTTYDLETGDPIEVYTINVWADDEGVVHIFVYEEPVPVNG